MQNLHIRQERSADRSPVLALVERAFRNEAFSDQREHLLVERLRDTAAFVPELSLVAEKEERIVGYILLTKIDIQGRDRNHPSLALAPVAVHPDFRGRGVGTALIREAHRRAYAIGFGSVVLLGHAAYYPRFGYRPAHHFGIELPFDVPAENAMVVELRPGSLKGVSGRVRYAPAFTE
ncbi:GNAT family N-acetyltransferase [Lewinella sp. IMCC34191]|uniref:GNAT family N-acetyltransferase n=1 Tax=Lewinella sp. IMCC34191 TaxID=2259172 RepID=UPI000E2524F4|nr:N-acetyltransferase [Lewinella sp. IMCC34191]